VLACLAPRRGSPSRRHRRRSLAEGPSTRTAGMRRIRHITLALVALATLLIAAAPSAHAKGYRDAIRDCYDDGQLEGHYSRHELQQALKHLPSDINEYSDCANVLRQALLAGTTRGGGGGTGPTVPGNPALVTPSGAQAGSTSDLNALHAATHHKPHAKAPAVAVGSHFVVPGASGLYDVANRLKPNKLPTSLLLALVALALMSALAGTLLVRHRWPETRSVALRLLRR